MQFITGNLIMPMQVTSSEGKAVTLPVGSAVLIRDFRRDNTAKDEAANRIGAEDFAARPYDLLLDYEAGTFPIEASAFKDTAPVKELLYAYKGPTFRAKIKEDIQLTNADGNPVEVRAGTILEVHDNYLNIVQAIQDATLVGDDDVDLALDFRFTFELEGQGYALPSSQFVRLKPKNRTLVLLEREARKAA